MKDFNFSKVAGLQPARLVKIEFLHRYFSIVFSMVAEQLFYKTPSFGCLRLVNLLVQVVFWSCLQVDFELSVIQ